MRIRIATAALIAATAAACASADTMRRTSGADLPVDIERYTHRDGETRFVSLEPIPIGEPPTVTAERVALAVGALYAGRSDRDDFHTLALVLRTRASGQRALFAEERNLLLQVDGQYVSSNPLPGGTAYLVDDGLGGIEETVMIPFSPDQIRALADAERVRGRLGPWFAFDLPRPQRRALLRILDEIPEGVAFNANTRVGQIIASQ